ncbi:SelT/selW/selH domain-containing protein [Powellomyces hirtus]|nr:SelT/selW/selH domain-containing protein [Powellomyces hirtus]
MADSDPTPQPMKVKYPRIEIEYCPGCRWMLRAAWTAQELLTTFESTLGEIALQPGPSGTFAVRLVPGEASAAVLLWDRKTEGRFPELKDLKQRVRDWVAPEKSLGHSDKKPVDGV